MIKKALEIAITQINSFMTREMIYLQIEFFYFNGQLTDVERQDLMDKLYPPEPEVPETPVEG